MNIFISIPLIRFLIPHLKSSSTPYLCYSSCLFCCRKKHKYIFYLISHKWYCSAFFCLHNPKSPCTSFLPRSYHPVFLTTSASLSCMCVCVVLFSAQGGSSWSICSRLLWQQHGIWQSPVKDGCCHPAKCLPTDRRGASRTTPWGRGGNSWTSATHSFILPPPPRPRRAAVEELEKKDLWPANGGQDTSQNALQ